MPLRLWVAAGREKKDEQHDRQADRGAEPADLRTDDRAASTVASDEADRGQDQHDKIEGEHHRGSDGLEDRRDDGQSERVVDALDLARRERARREGAEHDDPDDEDQQAVGGSRKPARVAAIRVPTDEQRSAREDRDRRARPADHRADGPERGEPPRTSVEHRRCDQADRPDRHEPPEAETDPTDGLAGSSELDQDADAHEGDHRRRPTRSPRRRPAARGPWRSPSRTTTGPRARSVAGPRSPSIRLMSAMMPAAPSRHRYEMRPASSTVTRCLAAWHRSRSASSARSRWSWPAGRSWSIPARRWRSSRWSPARAGRSPATSWPPCSGRRPTTRRRVARSGGPCRHCGPRSATRGS